MPSRMPRTSYGTIGEDYYEKLEETFGTHNINKQNDNSNNKQFSACGKSMIAAVILVFISLAAVSISEFAIPSSNTKSIKLDSVSRPIFATLQDYEKEALFRVFVDDYGKMYKTDEYQTKLTNFKNFLELCDSRNMAEAVVSSTAVHGVTMFADLTPSEFATYLGFVQSSTTSYGELVDSDKITTYDGTETTVDWTDIYTTSVRTQGYCGSCWAFSAVQQIESDTIRIVGTPYTTTSTLSVQQLVSCDSTSSGCSGGDSRMGYEYVMETGGLNMETNYPYTSYYDFAGSCDKTKSGYSIAVAQYYTITGADATTVETNMINYVKSTGPLSVCVDASEWSTYVSGTVAVCSTSPNHCVQIVGVNTDEGYWKIRNSWGTSWGEDGYIKLQLNADTCAITTVPTYTYTYLYGTTLAPTATPTTPYPSFEPTTASPTVEPTTEAPSFEPSFEPTAAEEEEEEEDEEEDEESEETDSEDEETDSEDEEEESDSEEITEETEDADESEETEDEEEEAETVEEDAETEDAEESEETEDEEEEAETVEEDAETEEEEETVEEEEEAVEEEANSSKRGSSKKNKKSSKKSSK